jgi:hypothetical protein
MWPGRAPVGCGNGRHWPGAACRAQMRHRARNKLHGLEVIAKPGLVHLKVKSIIWWGTVEVPVKHWKGAGVTPESARVWDGGNYNLINTEISLNFKKNWHISYLNRCTLLLCSVTACALISCMQMSPCHCNLVNHLILVIYKTVNKTFKSGWKVLSWSQRQDKLNSLYFDLIPHLTKL